MRVLHLSAEYPDELRRGTTHAIRRLVACAETFSDNHVMSLHRQKRPGGSYVRHRGDHSVVCEAGGGWPLGYRAFWSRCASTIMNNHPDGVPDLVHAHKASFEGCIAFRLRDRLKVPYCVSIRATDFGAFRRYFHLRGEFARTLVDAERIAVVSPWMITPLRSMFRRQWSGAMDSKLVVLGNVVDGELFARESHNGRYAMPLKLNRSQLARKNVRNTLRAIRRLKDGGHEIALDIIGSGTGMEMARLWVERLGLTANVMFLGEVPHSEMIGKLADYKGLALFSYPETFGLVYLEALRAGIPILHSRSTGVDGLFPAYRVGVAAVHNAQESLVRAFLYMEAGEADYRCEVRRLQQSGGLDPFTSQGFARRLATDLYGWGGPIAQVGESTRSQEGGDVPSAAGCRGKSGERGRGG